MAGKFELKTIANGKFMFNLKAGNGEIILSSQQYKSRRNALKGIESVRKNAAEDAQFETREPLQTARITCIGGITNHTHKMSK